MSAALSSGPTGPIDEKHEVEDSAEMQEAAEQLKALSHVRHLSDEAGPLVERQRTTLPDGAMHPSPGDTGSSHDANESGADESLHIAELSTPNSRPKPRRSLQKSTPRQETRCTLCSHEPFKDSSSLRKHIAAAHTRPFPCAFFFAGCAKGKGNEFNRKDLFTQHLRRMHAPFAIKKAIAKGDGKLQAEWDGHVKEMQQSCLVTRRLPPQRSACPKPDCKSVFEGPGSWDEWTEHVGRHMEKGEGQRLGVDRLLAKWALEENIIERQEDGEYRLLPVNGTLDGNPRETGRDAMSTQMPDTKSEDIETTKAVAEHTEDKMEVDN
ncbi:hypothetical protein ACHAPS_006009 [Verticillium nonalfalfae]